MARLTNLFDGEYLANENANHDPWNCVNKLGKLEDLEESGRLIVLPCVTGDNIQLAGIIKAKYICFYDSDENLIHKVELESNEKDE